MAKHHSTKDFKFYTQSEYRAELIKRVRSTKRGDRVLLMSMTLMPTEPEIASILDELTLAASRGVNVTLSVDANSFLTDESYVPGPLWGKRNLPKNLRGVYKHKWKAMQAINAYPTGHAEIINIPTTRFALPVSGRSHIKTAIVNDYVFLGGCNLMKADWVDVMVGWQDSEASDNLYRIFQNIIRTKHAGKALSWVDRSLPIDNSTEVLIDAGLKGQSLIYEEALRLIDSAEKWLLITGQYFPNSITTRHLKRAVERGVDVEVIFTHPRHHGLIGGTGQRVSIMRERMRAPQSLFVHRLGRRGPMTHAKLLACDKGVMIGSHNYVWAGVSLGTAEIALKSTHEKLAKDAVKTLRRGLKAANE